MWRSKTGPPLLLYGWGVVIRQALASGILSQVEQMHPISYAVRYLFLVDHIPTPDVDKGENAPESSIAKRCLQYSWADEDYGPDAAVRDMHLDQLEVAKEEYVQKLTSECTEDQRDNIECRSRGQSLTHEWKEEKRKKLTASNFGNIIQSIRYPPFVGTTGTKWGIENEHVALTETSKHLLMPFRRSGLIILPEHPFLGPPKMLSSMMMLFRRLNVHIL
ncbi:hypothetical protein PR048_022671 [Dryococelus australis]|uniref:Uncharacterized protein n=1 Tax=Dryococelus australis TaxID=614101 RepID=A0ABQ9GRX6_9NEOP|nr:hypothetical protein PR048_022671 [Dryococelus australis]